MVRTVAFSQQTHEPTWLTQGKLVLQSQQAPDQLGEEAKELFAEIGARTARRFARIAQFLEDNYPDYFRGKKRIQAGSAAMLEFMKLVEVDEPAALAVAEPCLGGQLGARELKAMREDLQGTWVPSAITSRAEGSRRAGQFTELAERRLLEPKLFPGLEPLMNAKPPATKGEAAPDFVMVNESTGQIVVMEVKAPSATAARSISYVAGQLVARVALLRMRYDDAVLVLPRESETIARETIHFWDNWVTKKEPLQQGLSILLLNDKTHKIIKSKRVWHDEGAARRNSLVDPKKNNP